MLHSNGVIKKPNAIVCGQERPHTVVKDPHISRKAVLWRDMLKAKITGPYFFSKPDETRKKLQKGASLIYYTQNTEPACIFYFQQDGAPL